VASASPASGRRLAFLAGSVVLAAVACAGSAATPGPPASAGPGFAGIEAGHEASQGPLLGSDPDAESVYAGDRCDPAAPRRDYRVLAIDVDISLNRYLDHDPNGRMYVLEDDLARVRQEEAQNAAARGGAAEPAVSIGLQGDAIQPLVLRTLPGECLRISLRNDLTNGEPASLHVHDSSLHLADGGSPALATNPEAMAAPGQTVTYEWMVPADEPEGAHLFHSHGDVRPQTSHGLFGALVVEPKDARFLDPTSGAELRSGWSAIIRDPAGSAFREFVMLYHEVGDESYRQLDKGGQLVAQVDPFSTAYRPGDRALNYRSEPFMNRLALQQKVSGRYDKSLPYSSYAFGDPATPLARSYLGDPVKQRVVDGGSEVFHVHHVHGGAIRWRRQAGAEASNFDSGLDKHPALLPTVSERVDSQAIGPSETYDVVDECGSGGCQQDAGDFLIHCHIAHHYLAGMWMIWRVYDTKQDGSVLLDLLPPLQELPDRSGRMLPAVASDKLIGRTVDWKGQTFSITAQNFAEWVERQLPPPGTPKGYDASVLDWRREGDVYLNEADTDQVWPGFRSPTPGARPPLYFDPITGKLAYPFLRPHLGKRPPFAPNHGPAPFLEPIHAGTSPPAPGENGPWSLCPAGTRPKQFVIHAITLPIPVNSRFNLLDPSGELYVLKGQEDAVRANDAMKLPLAIRANAGEDCVDVVLKSELQDDRQNGFLSKADLHIHFVQFDVQASDGVDTGFNYEQSVRPFKTEGETLQQPSAAGASQLRLSSAERFQPGILVGVGMEQDKTFEVARVARVNGSSLVLDRPLGSPHGRGEIVSTEFVRYRWYPDVQLGTVYFHDHVDALTSWAHGLFGAFVCEPPGSSYHDPQNGAALDSGLVADVHTNSPVSFDIAGSFRELVMLIQDSNVLTHFGTSSGSTFDMRAEPLDKRGGDPATLFDIRTRGDPATPVLQAYLGDPIVVRALVAGTNEVHTWHLDGHWFRAEPYSSRSPPIDTIHIGISERYDLSIPRAGGPQGLPGDYLYYDGRASKLREGSWGVVRVLDGSSGATLRTLPGYERPPPPASSVCPAGAPEKRFAVAAIEAPLPMLGGKGKLYALQEDVDGIVAGSQPPRPFTLHVNVGDCVRVQLRNDTAGPVSFHAGMLAYDPREDAPAAPGAARSYTFFAAPDVGETVALVRDWGNVLENPGLGLYGAIVVGPSGGTYRDPASGRDAAAAASWRADVTRPDGTAYRDSSLFFQDDDMVIGTAQMPYSQRVQGVIGLNYGASPLPKGIEQLRTGQADPATPRLEAYVGDSVRLHVLAPLSEQAHVFTVEGHRWPFEPGRRGTPLVSSVQLGGMEAITLNLDGGAGGPAGLPGDYLYGDHREPYREAGLWGLFRVYPKTASGTGLRPLRAPGCHGQARGAQAAARRPGKTLAGRRRARPGWRADGGIRGQPPSRRPAGAGRRDRQRDAARSRFQLARPSRHAHQPA
jgi:multicopper oxidase